MTEQEYLQKTAAARRVYDLEIDKLNTEFILSNAKYKVGDLVEDHVGKAKVIKITGQILSRSAPLIYYHCLELKKDGTERKKSSTRLVYQSNIL